MEGSVSLIACIPETEWVSDFFGQFAYVIKGPYENCELFFDHPVRRSWSFGFIQGVPFQSIGKNYKSRSERNKAIETFELKLTGEEQDRLFIICQQALIKYRYSETIAFKTVLPSQPNSYIMDRLLKKLYDIDTSKKNSRYKEHCCSSLIAQLLDEATNHRLSKNEKDFSPFSVTTTDLVWLCKANLEAKLVEKINTHKDKKKQKLTIRNGILASRQTQLEPPNIAFLSLPEEADIS